MKHLYPLLFILTLFSLGANAIVMRHDREPNLYQVKNSDYASVINMKYMMGTLIHPQWIVTAAHATHILPGHYKTVINGQDYFVEFIVPHPEYDQGNQNNDIALLKLDRPVEGVNSVAIYTRQDEKLQQVWFVGSGYIGNGKLGITGPASSLNHAQNIVDSVDPLWINFDFDSPENNPLELEGISGPGDSGGPAFIETSEGLKVAGISSHQLNDDNTPEGLYGVGEQYTRVSQYVNWINLTLRKNRQQLKAVALSRVTYQPKAATAKEILPLLGRYKLEDGSLLVLKKCGENICYSFVGRPGQSKIFKSQQLTDKPIWYTPNLNRIFEIVKSSQTEVTELIIKDFIGERRAIKNKDNH